jgi:hypothetical protein
MPETDVEDDWYVPEKGVIEFSFGTRRIAGQKEETMTLDEMSHLVEVRTDAAK